MRTCWRSTIAPASSAGKWRAGPGADAANGQRVWQKRLGGIFFASPVGADGKVYMVSETGETFVLRAGREPDVIATNDLGERFLASPAISGGRIFLRSDGSLFAVGK